MGCVFHATSTKYSFKNIIHEVKLETYRLFDKDEETIKGISRNYCFSCIVSEANWSNTKKQFEDMKLFIRNNKNKLELIKEKNKNIDWRFDLPIESRLGGNVVVQCDYLDVELIKLSAELNIGIELSYYPKENVSMWKRIKSKFRLTIASI